MTCKHFLLEQLVPPDIHAALGVKAWDLLDPNLLVTLDQLYEYFGRITVNNWHTGGKFKESGLRDPNSKTGAPKSQHKLGKAADCKPLDVTVRFMYEEILKHVDKFPLLNVLEDIAYTPTWVHCSVQAIQVPRIRIIKP